MKFDDLIDEVIDKQRTDFVPAVLAEKFVKRIRKEDPGALAEWLEARTVILVTTEIQRRLTLTRRQAIHRAKKRKVFDAVGSGDPDGLFAQWYEVDGEHTRRVVAEMTGGDHQFVADGYRMSSALSATRAAFHDAVAKKIGNRRTSDVFTEAEYEQLLRSIVK